MNLLDKLTKSLAKRNFRKGNYFWRKNQTLKAVKSYKKATFLDADYSAAYHNLAGCYAQLEKWDESLETYQYAIKLNPNFTWSHFCLGEALYNCKCWEEAITCFNSAIDLKPDFFESFNLLGDALLELDRFTEALHAYKESIKINPNIWYLYTKLSYTFFKLEVLPEAIDAYMHAIKLNPEYCWSYFNLAESLICEGEWDKAVDLLHKCKNIDPTLPGLNDKIDEAIFLQTQWEILIDFCNEKNIQKNNNKLTNSNGAEPLNILMLTPYSPFPPDTGGTIRMYEQIKYFGSRHKLVLASFYLSESYADINKHLGEYCEQVFLFKMGGQKNEEASDLPNMIIKNKTDVMWQALNKLSHINFDLVLFEFIHMSPYLELFSNTFTVLSEHNIESNILKQYSKDIQTNTETHISGNNKLDYKAESDLLEKYEDKVWPSFSLRTAVSNYDKEILSGRIGSGDTIVVPNCIDTHNIQPVEYNYDGKILFMGHLSYYPNIDAVIYFTEEILPLVWEKDPNLKFCIAGRTPVYAIEKLAENPQIDLIANPEDMSRVAQDCSMTIVPVRLGSGTRIKILHSMALGLPVISTTLGCEGLDINDHKHLLVADKPNVFANAILEIKSNDKLRNKIRMNGRYLAKTKYTWDTNFQHYEDELVGRLNKRETIV